MFYRSRGLFNFCLFLVTIKCALLNGLASTDKLMSHPRPADSHQPFSSVETTSGTKLSPNGAAIRQWETRSWISTIPLQKAVSIGNGNNHANHENTATKRHGMESGLAATSAPNANDQFDYEGSKYTASSDRDNDPQDPRNYPIIMTSTNISHHHGPQSEPRSRSSSVNEGDCRGEACRKKPFQGTYDTVNYQKKMVYPDKHSTRVNEPGYQRKYKNNEDEYVDEGGHQNGLNQQQQQQREQPIHHHQHQHHRSHNNHNHSRSHNSDETSDRDNERDGRTDQVQITAPTPNNLNWQHHAHPKGRSSRWDSFDSPSNGNNDHDSDHDGEWNRKDWRERSNFGKDSDFNSKSSFRSSMDGEDNEGRNAKDNHQFQRDHQQTRRRKYNNNDAKEEPRPGQKDHYEFDRQEYEKERDREWKSYSNGRNSENDGHNNKNHQGSGYFNGKSDERWKSGKDEHDNGEGRGDKSPRGHGDNHHHNSHPHHHQRSHYDSNSTNGERSGKSIGSKEKSKPKVRTYHHDEETPDGYSHAHGYEKEEVEGTRFFEPSGLTDTGNNNNYNQKTPSHHLYHQYQNEYNNTVDDHRQHGNNNGNNNNNNSQNQDPNVNVNRLPSGRITGKSKQQCDCSGGVNKGRLVEVNEEASAKAKAAAASAARVKRQDESGKVVFGARSGFSGQKLKANYLLNSDTNETKSKS